MKKRWKLTALVLTTLMAASLTGPACAGGGVAGGGSLPPLPNNRDRGGGQSFQSPSSSQGEVQNRSVVSGTESFDGFAFPYFYGGFFPF